MAIVIKSNGERYELKGDNKNGSVSAVQINKIVGGYFEVISITPLVAFGCDHMYLNDEGKLLGLPYNEEATVVAADKLYGGDVIVGNVVLCTLNSDGDSF